jgi:hypothetical protein
MIMNKKQTPKKELPHKNGTVYEKYIPVELKPYEGRPGANDHLKYGSLVNGVKIPYRRPGLFCVGVAPTASLAGSARRFPI